MPILHNRISNKELKARMLANSEMRTTLSFYKYFSIHEPQNFRDNLYQKWSKLGVLGRTYIAAEGINAQISVPTQVFETFKTQLFELDPALNGIRLNIALEDSGKSFWALRIKVRHRIVADGIQDMTFNADHVGKYLNAQEVNYMLADPETIFVDMRNHYEYEVGHFENAMAIPADTFREQLPMAIDMLQPLKEKKLVLYCTGGIRCEKATAYLIHHGFKQVWHVEGGIIEYVRQAKAQSLPIKFIGKNFVFDERMGERVTDDIIATCHQCGKPCDSHTNCASHSCHLLFIQCAECAVKFDLCCSESCKEAVHSLEKPDNAKPPYFNKSYRQLQKLTPSNCKV